MRTLLLAFIVLLWIGVSASVAQPPAPPGGLQRPTFSPYLNLLNRNFSPAVNYLGFVRPQQQMAQQFNYLSSQLMQANQRIQGLQMQSDQLQNDLMGGLPVTGNIPLFMNTGHYFSYNPALMGGGGIMGGLNRGGMGFGGPSLGMGMNRGPLGMGANFGNIGQAPSPNFGGNRGGSRGGAGVGMPAVGGIRR